MDALPVSVVVIVRNAETIIEKCLDSVAAEGPAEIIVVDGNSTDRTVELARRHTQRVYSDNGMGLSIARRIGALQARESYVAYVDSDVLLPIGTIATLLNELEGSKLSGIAARTRPMSTTSYWQRASQWHSDILVQEGGIHLLGTLLKREMVLDVGFDPFIRGGEDHDFVIRARHMGYSIGLSANTFVYHLSPVTFRGLVGRLWRYGDDVPRWVWKYGLLKPRYWPPVAAVYRIGYCLAKRRIDLIPYFVLAGFVQSVAAVFALFQFLLKRSPSERLPPIRWL